MVKPPSKSHCPKRACSVCHGTETKLLYQQVFSQLSDGGSLLSGYDLVACRECGFCYADKIPPQAVFDSYYREMSKYEQAGRGGKDSAYDGARFRGMANLILGFLTSPETCIFEVGCANGQLLALLKEQGYDNVSGIDPSPISAAIARERFGIQVSANTLSGLASGGEPIDFLILAGVLEHVRDLNSALLRLGQLLSPGGVIFITVPNAARYDEGEDAPFQEFSVEHVNFFGPRSLENLLSANGFAPVTIIQDMIESNHRTRTSVIHGLFRKSDLPGPIIFPRDNLTEAGLNRYIVQSAQTDRRIQTRIDEIVDSGRSIVVWGTGAHTLRLLASTRLGHANIRAYVDSNPRYQGKSLNQIVVVSPIQLREMPEPILISSRVYQEEIGEQIRTELGLGNELIRLY